MTDKDGDQYQDRLEEAKKQGKDFVLYDYQDFNARFAQCVWCDWIECLAVDWQVGTRADNMRDMAEKGRARSVPRPGESNPFSRLTWEQVEGIRADERPHRAIAADYGVHQTTISRVKRRDTWI